MTVLDSGGELSRGAGRVLVTARDWDGGQDRIRGGVVVSLDDTRRPSGRVRFAQSAQHVGGLLARGSGQQERELVVAASRSAPRSRACDVCSSPTSRASPAWFPWVSLTVSKSSRSSIAPRLPGRRARSRGPRRRTRRPPARCGRRPHGARDQQAHPRSPIGAGRAPRQSARGADDENPSADRRFRSRPTPGRGRPGRAGSSGTRHPACSTPRRRDTARRARPPAGAKCAGSTPGSHRSPSPCASPALG